MHDGTGRLGTITAACERNEHHIMTLSRISLSILLITTFKTYTNQAFSTRHDFIFYKDWNTEPRKGDPKLGPRKCHGKDQSPHH